VVVCLCFTYFAWSQTALLGSLQILEGHSDEIFSCAFNYEGDFVITGSKDNTCRSVFWDFDWITAQSSALLPCSILMQIVHYITNSPQAYSQFLW
jgi:WD40 repeat protein